MKNGWTWPCLCTVASVAWVLGACSGGPGRPEHEIAGAATDASPAPRRSQRIEVEVLHRSPSTGLPSFARVALSAGQPPRQDPVVAARWVLSQLRSEYGLSEAALQAAVPTLVHDLGHGAVVVRLEQRVDGLEVYGRAVTLAFDAQGQPLAISGQLAPSIRRLEREFRQSEAEVVETALSQLMHSSLPGSTIASGPADGPYRSVRTTPVQLAGQRLRPTRPARVKRILYPQKQGLIPAYYAEVFYQHSGSEFEDNDAPGAHQLSAFVVSAADGTLLSQERLSDAAAHAYRVRINAEDQPLPDPHGSAFWPHPTGVADGSKPTNLVSPALRTLDSLPFGQNDPWLPADATQARGNNVWAFLDLASPAGFGTGDLSLVPSSPLTFDYSADPNQDARTSDSTRRAALTQVFYTLNYLHDVFYDAGFNEQAGNAQQDNLGRGGKGGDPIIAVTQAFDVPNNATTTVPRDGASPEIRFGLCDGPNRAEVVQPMDIAGTLSAARALFGPTHFDLTGDLVLVDDGLGTSTSDGCETPFVNAAAVSGKLALIDRGGCSFLQKVRNAQAAGALGVVIRNDATALINMSGVDATITIPALMITQADGTTILNKLMAGTAVQFRLAIAGLDCATDVSWVAHEFGHVLNQRLGVALSGFQANTLREGWADFITLLALVPADAAAAASNAGWNGAFPILRYSRRFLGTDNYYYGVRRYPYSRDLAKNPLTFRYITNGVALPASPPPLFGANGANNAARHTSAELWASVLWDCYTNLLLATDRYSFAQAQQAMREDLVASIMLTPPDPTILQARDALLAVIQARSPADMQACAASFARRGMGIGAVGPAPNDATYAGVVESNQLGGDLAILSVTLDDSSDSCDGDGIVDAREVGRLTVRVRNTGSTTISDAKLTVSADEPLLVFRDAASVALPALAPYQDHTQVFEFTIRDATTQITPTIHVQLESADLLNPRTLSQDLKRRMNYDVVPAATQDDFAIRPSNWQASGDPQYGPAQYPWQQITDEAGAGRFFIPEFGQISDQSLISPPIHVAPTGSFGFRMMHRYSLEASMSKAFDGGIIEISTDDGQTWTDIGAMLTGGGYNDLLNDPSTGNPLLDAAHPMQRMAFVRQSTGYPAYSETVADLGTAYAGQTVRLRFRVGTDTENAGGGTIIGWDIDSITLSGVSQPPFLEAVPHTRDCNRGPIVTVTPTDATVQAGETFTLTGTVQDPEDDPVTYEWQQRSGPPLGLPAPKALTQTFVVPPVGAPAQLVFALVASDGKIQTQAVARITLKGESAPMPPPEGCSCRSTPTPLGGDVGLLYLLSILLAGYHCRRRAA